MNNNQTLIFNKISEMEISYSDNQKALLSAVGRGCSLNVECNEIGTSVFLMQGGKESSFIISKGNLSSVGFSSSRKPILLKLGVISIIVGFIPVEGWGGPLLLDYIPTPILGIILIVLYFFLRLATLEFESSGGKTLPIQFSGSAVRDTGNIARFCRAVIMIDQGIESEAENVVLSIEETTA